MNVPCRVMSFHHTKTNYVRPHAKASYIRPLRDYNENESVLKESVSNFDASMKYAKSPAEESDSLSVEDSLKGIDDAKEKHLQNLNSAHSKLYDEIDKIQSWRTSVELECKQKNKKADELAQTVESQRKVVLDLQMQNENLSLQLSEEIQKRVSVLEKFYFTKEVCSTLQKKFSDLQGQFDACYKIKEAVDVCNEENAKAIENLEKKFSIMCMEYSEKNAHLRDALKNEKHNNLVLKDLCEQQNLNAEKQNKSFCKLIENYQEELKNNSRDLESEKNKSLDLEQEKKEMLQRISYLENYNDVNLNKLKDAEEQLKLAVENKLEIEKKYSSEAVKVDSLNRKCKEVEELKNIQKTEFEENCLVLKTTISSLENSLFESKQKLEESELMNEKLSVILKEREKEKSCLENEISDIEKERKELENKLLIDARISDEITNQLMKEKNDLNISLKLVQEELQKALSDKENLSKLCSENDEKFLLISGNYEVAVSKIEELGIIQDKYNETLKKIAEMEADMQMKSELLISKELYIEEMQDLKVKYGACLINIKELEESVKSKSEQLELKDMSIKELSSVEEQLAEAINKIKDLENDIVSKNELITSKDMRIEELSIVEEKLDEAMNKIKELEKDIVLKNEIITSKEENIKELNDVEQIYATNLGKIKELEHNIQHKSELLDEKERKVKELDHFKNVLADTEKELENQRQRASYNMKLLGESEDNFDEMRIKKEKEIIKCKDTIQSLQHQLRILKVEVGQAEKLRTENEKLRMDIEELKLQNAGDIQRLKTENEKQRIEFDALRLKNKSPFQRKADNGEKMEADSSNEEVTVIREEIKPKCINHKRFSKEVNKKITNLPKISTPLIVEKRKRGWESESSGSDCLEIVFDKDSKKLGLASKGKFTESKRHQDTNKTPKTPINIAVPGRPTSSQDKKRDMLIMMDKEVPSSNKSIKSKTIHSFATKPSMNTKSVEDDTPDNADFFRCTESGKKVNTEDSPWMRRNAEIKRTPSTPGQRKFFKTPLKEREFPFKRPQLQNLWF